MLYWAKTGWQVYLVNILYGLYQPDAGEILLNGKPVQIDGPNTAINYGIGMVHQHFMLVEPFTVAENIVLGCEPRRSLVQPAASNSPSRGYF